MLLHSTLAPENQVAAELTGRWERMCAGTRAADDTTVLKVVLAAYSHPSRAHHNLIHLAEVLRRIDELAPAAAGADSEAVAWAAWFHDVVYDTRAADSELRSADVAATSMERLRMPGTLIAEVKRLIVLTADHAVGDDDVSGAWLSDADLAILGAAPDRYRRYTRAVRSEYEWVDDGSWQAGRAKVLRSLLGHFPLYRLPGQDGLEAQAVLNMRAELDCLVAQAPTTRGPGAFSSVRRAP